jgi:hypothetical protein
MLCLHEKVYKLILVGCSIVFRAFQGIGGSGIYSMVMVVIPEIVPLPKLGLASGGVGAMLAHLVSSDQRLGDSAFHGRRGDGYSC